MPINDERRRFRGTKAIADAKPQAKVTTEGELGSKDRIQESLQKLREMLLSQRGEFLAGKEEQIEANKEAVQRARKERDEKYERLQQAFERMNNRKDEGAEAAKRVQGTNPVCEGMVRLTHGAPDEDGFRLVEEVMEKYRRQYTDARMFVESE